MRNKSKAEESKEDVKTISFKEAENMLERNLKLTKAGMITGLVVGTGLLATGIFLPKEINELWERIAEFSMAGLDYTAAVGNYLLYRITQFQITELHMRPEYMEAFKKSFIGD
jgi:hypothetical protein